MIVNLKYYTPWPELVCAEAAAVCTNYTGDPMNALRGAMKSGHTSVLEHASFTFHVSGVSRVLLAQLTRHRLASFSVQSQRYCGADFGLVIPDSMAIPELVDDIITAKKVVEDLYTKATGLGIPDEDARYLTFQAGKTALDITMNARELRKLYKFGRYRCSKVLIAVDDIVVNALTSEEIIEDVWEEIGLRLNFDEPFDRIEYRRKAS